MSLRKQHFCRPAATVRNIALGFGAGAALLAGAPSATAQTCSPSLGIEFVGLPPGTVFTVGQSFDVNVNFGAISVPIGGTMTINTITLRLDCQPGTGCEPECVDGGPLIAYDGDSSLSTNCGTVTSNNPGGGTGTNTIVFTFTPPVVLTANQSCDLQFGLTVNSLGVATSPKLITSRVSFLGDCSGTTLDALVCGTFEIPLTNPDIEIVKTACPTLVNAAGENVTYSYVVTTGSGNAPISNVVVTDTHCGPVVGPISGDDGDNVLEPGESWVYNCTTLITQTTVNVATVNGEYVNGVGSTPVTDDDDAVVNVVTVNTIPGDCETTYIAKTDGCDTPTCSWTGPGGYSANTCEITLGAGSATGEYCVTVTCPGLEEGCPFGCGQPGQPACEPRSATVCIDFDQPDAPACEIDGPVEVCAGETHQYCGPADLDSYLWSENSAGCEIVGSNTTQCVDVLFTGAGNCLVQLHVEDNGCVNDCDLRVTAENCEVLTCRVTGGGNCRSVDYALNPNGQTNRYTHGGQCGAPDQVHGEWTHSQKTGPAGKWTFHAGTSSAPDETFLRVVNCCDSDGTGNLTYCFPARPAPAKQINLEGIGVFKNTGNPQLPPGVVVHGANRTFHWVTIHVEDLGEPGNNGQHQPQPNPAICPVAGANCATANCECPDFYRITIHQGVTAANIDQAASQPKLYEVYSYMDGGNHQIHPPIGDVNSDTIVNAADLNLAINNFGKTGIGDIDGNGIVESIDVANILAHWGETW